MEQEEGPEKSGWVLELPGIAGQSIPCRSSKISDPSLSGWWPTISLLGQAEKSLERQETSFLGEYPHISVSTQNSALG